MIFYLSIMIFLCWGAALLLPWHPWQTREVLEAAEEDKACNLSNVTVIIPARNEAEVIAGTLAAIKDQGQGLKVIVVDDDSSDATVQIAKASGLPDLTVIESKTLPSGWSGKLWAQEQGLQLVNTDFTLLLDADIELKPGMIKGLQQKCQSDNLHFVSLMAVLRFDSFWEKLLMPAFVYFFRMIYPFALANKKSSTMAAAAGGCIFLETSVLTKTGGMAVIKDAIIDDCSLAKTIKNSGYNIWVGLTHGVVSQRPYVTLAEIWQMVVRTAFTQLHYSVVLLLLCSATMLLMYWWPLLAVFTYSGMILILNILSLLIMMALLLPTLYFYRLNPLWALPIPVIAALYLMMTWTSAFRYWRGEKARWKGRSYQKSSGTLN